MLARMGHHFSKLVGLEILSRKDHQDDDNNHSSWSKVGAKVVPKGFLNSGFPVLRPTAFLSSTKEEVLMRNQLEMVANFLWYNLEFCWMNGLHE